MSISGMYERHKQPEQTNMQLKTSQQKSCHI